MGEKEINDSAAISDGMGCSDSQTARIGISVRDLVEFVLRSGDIDNRIAQSDMNAMQDGSRLHRKLQQAAGEDYRSEVKMKIEAAPNMTANRFCCA
ncbi:MAG: hypothetical protein K6E85_07510 [Lachnospiraceae bacterium]|nr:hypothetical protein [Lachnospiraceae bacterium]